METKIVRNADGSLTMPKPQSAAQVADALETGEAGSDTVTLHPGFPGFPQALAEWDLQQNPDREPVISTATGRDEAKTLVHSMATDPELDAHAAVKDVADPTGAAEALRHVLVGGKPSVKGFAAEVAESEGGDALAPHQVTKIIGKVLAELDN